MASSVKARSLFKGRPLLLEICTPLSIGAVLGFLSSFFDGSIVHPDGAEEDSGDSAEEEDDGVVHLASFVNLMAIRLFATI
jgi:hypothetical protein